MLVVDIAALSCLRNPRALAPERVANATEPTSGARARNGGAKQGAGAEASRAASAPLRGPRRTEPLGKSNRMRCAVPQCSGTCKRSYQLGISWLLATYVG